MSVYILFSTSWSAQNGGINAINYDLASTLNANAQEIFAIVSDATDSDISDAARLVVENLYYSITWIMQTTTI